MTHVSGLSTTHQKWQSWVIEEVLCFGEQAAQVVHLQGVGVGVPGRARGDSLNLVYGFCFGGLMQGDGVSLAPGASGAGVCWSQSESGIWCALPFGVRKVLSMVVGRPVSQCRALVRVSSPPPMSRA